MTTDDTTVQTPQPSPAPDAAVQRLDKLVGTWGVQGHESDPEGEIHGRVTFEWLDGSFFLVEHVDLDHSGRKVKGIEIIGRERAFGADGPSQEIRSRVYDNAGNTLDYVYELEGDALTIWGGYVGSPANFKGTFGDDGRRLVGRWEWPGGGYEATMTRLE